MNKKSVFITGVSRENGLGTAIVRHYLKEKFVVFACSRNISGDHLVKLHKQYPDNLYLIKLDVCDMSSICLAVEEVRKITGKIDILISNARGRNSASDGNLPIDNGMNLDHMLDSYDVNTVAFLRLVQKFLPLTSSGSILAAISSEQGSMGRCWRDHGLEYGMSKAALNYAAVVLQRRLSVNGQRVLAIHPGWVQTFQTPPKADFSPEESAANIARIIANPPQYNAEDNSGVYLNYDGTTYPF